MTLVDLLDNVEPEKPTNSPARWKTFRPDSRQSLVDRDDPQTLDCVLRPCDGPQDLAVLRRTRYRRKRIGTGYLDLPDSERTSVTTTRSIAEFRRR